MCCMMNILFKEIKVNWIDNTPPIPLPLFSIYQDLPLSSYHSPSFSYLSPYFLSALSLPFLSFSPQSSLLIVSPLLFILYTPPLLFHLPSLLMLSSHSILIPHLCPLSPFLSPVSSLHHSSLSLPVTCTLSASLSLSHCHSLTPLRPSPEWAVRRCMKVYVCMKLGLVKDVPGILTQFKWIIKISLWQKPINPAISRKESLYNITLVYPVDLFHCSQHS